MFRAWNVSRTENPLITRASRENLTGLRWHADLVSLCERKNRDWRCTQAAGSAWNIYSRAVIINTAKCPPHDICLTAQIWPRYDFPAFDVFEFISTEESLYAPLNVPVTDSRLKFRCCKLVDLGVDFNSYTYLGINQLKLNKHIVYVCVCVCVLLFECTLILQYFILKLTESLWKLLYVNLYTCPLN